MTQAASSRLLSDAVIARRAAGGNQRAFASIFERYHQELYRYCAALLGNAEDAQDAVQNTMLKVLRALPGDQRDLKLKPWLYRIAHNEAIDMIRTRRHAEAIDAEVLAAAGGPAEEAEARARLQQLVSDIGELPTRQRGALVMREMSGLSYTQIGEALQTSSAAARQTIYEARLSLRQISEGREMPCQEVMRAISDHDGRVLRRRDIRAHLHRCESCNAFRGEISERRREFASLAPLPAAASAGILQSLLGGAGSGGGGAGSAAGAAAGKALAGPAAIKSTAAVLAISAIGVVAANRSGMIDLGVGDRHTAPARATPSTTSSTAHRAGRQAAARTARRRALQAVEPGVAQGDRGRRIVGRAAAQRTSPRSTVAAPGSGDRLAEGGPQSSGHSFGASEGSGEAKGLGTKADHPVKTTKGASATAPGHAKAPPGQTERGAEKGGGNGGGEAQPTHPDHPEHPAHPAHPPQPKETQPSVTPEPKAEPPAEEKAADDNGMRGEPTAE